MFDTSNATTTLTMPVWMLPPTAQHTLAGEESSGVALFGLYPDANWATVTPLSKPVTVYRPKTALARRLWEIRQRIISAGTPLLDWDGVKETLAERRGE
jgi:hypothetical protein